MPRFPGLHSYSILASSASIFILFLGLTGLVAKNIFYKLDFDSTVILQDHLPRFLDAPFSLISVIGSAEVTGIIWLALAFFLIWRKQLLAALVFSCYFLGIAIELLGKLIIHHPAPPHLFYRGVFHFDLPSSYVQTYFSYPSGHVFRTAFLITFLISYIYPKPLLHKSLYLAALLLFLCLTLVSRVYLGEHWVSDVMGGLLLGVSLGLLPAITLPARHTDN